MNLAQEIAPRELQPQAPVFQIDRNDTQFEMLINNHIQATFANPQVLAWAFTDFLNYMAFHMVVYMKLNITKDDNEDGTYKGATYMVNETWPTGYLYDEETKIVQVSYSVGSPSHHQLVRPCINHRRVSNAHALHLMIKAKEIVNRCMLN